jgi:hypothetical protein
MAGSRQNNQPETPDFSLIVEKVLVIRFHTEKDSSRRFEK